LRYHHHKSYAPTEQAHPEIKNKHDNELSNTLTNVKKQDIIILMDDTHSQVGKDNTGIEKIMGKHGEGILNNRERFIGLCSAFALTTGGTIFAHTRCHKITWVSPDYKIQNQIDHITINSVQ
jgi:hypothetical protein